MSNSNFNGFPIDGSYGSQIKYDLFAKYMGSAISSVNSTNTSNAGIIGLFLSIIQIILTIVLTALLLLGKLIGFIIGLFFASKVKRQKEIEKKEYKTYVDNLCSGLDKD